MEGNLQQFEQKRQTPPPLPTTEELPIAKQAKKAAESPPSDRVEHHVVEARPTSRRQLNIHKPKIIVSKEAQEISAAIRWARAHGEAGREVSEKKQSGESAATERLRFHSGKEREWADRLIKQFETRLRDTQRGIDEDEMDGFAEKFATSQKELERLQEEARFIPAQEHGGVTSANYDTIRRLERAIAASKFPPQQALGELTHGKVGMMELEAEERGKEAEDIANELSSKIEAAYGAPPEDLIQGRGPLGKRLKFTFKNWVGRISGQETDFDRWQRAERDKQSAELARIERLPHERKRRFTAEEKQRQEKISLAQRLEAEKAKSEATETNVAKDQEWNAMLAEEVAEQKKPKTVEIQPEDVDVELVEARKETIEPPKIRARSRKVEWEAKNLAEKEAATKQEKGLTQMTVERAAKLVPYSAAMWDKVKSYFEKNPAAASAFPMASWPNPKEHPITNYVLLVAKYYEAKKAGDEEGAKKAYDALKKFADALSIPENEILTLTKKQKGSEMVAGIGTVREAARRGATKRQEARFKF